MKEIFAIGEPKATEVPILLSVPHCGTQFPDELREQYLPDLIEAPDDTDWFVDKLYDFAPDMGITMISARISRWVIDLNRDPDEKPLYSDGRIITGLCPVTSFFGESLYRDGRKFVDPTEVAFRRSNFFIPYHAKVQELLDGLIQRHGKVLLWDCHSIRQLVPTIHKESFPDLILGDANGTTASPGLIEVALSTLDHSSYHTRHNSPFKGGYITRHFGKPGIGQHALQLEMTKVNYMDASEKMFDEKKAGAMRTLLKSVFQKLIEQL